VPSAHAEPILSQLDNNASLVLPLTAGQYVAEQTIYGISGNLVGVGAWVKSPSSVTMAIIDCGVGINATTTCNTTTNFTNSYKQAVYATSSATGLVTAINTGTGDEVHWYFDQDMAFYDSVSTATTSSYTLLASHSYVLVFYNLPNQAFTVYGSATDQFQGQCYASNGATFQPAGVCTGIKDVYLTLRGITNLGSDVSYISPTQTPATGSTEPDTTVTFNFLYSGGTDDIDSYEIVILDQNTLESSTITGSATTGINEVFETVVLNSGHLYNWKIFLLDSNENVLTFSSENTFSVVTSYLDVIAGFATSTFPYYDPFTVSESQATSSISNTAGWTSSLFRVFLKKWPFSWIAETNDLLTDLSTSTIYSF